MKPRFLTFIMALMLMALIVGHSVCLAQSVKPQGKVVVGLSSDMKILDPNEGMGGTHKHFHVNCYEGLYKRNWKGEMIPGLALSHTMRDNGLTYIFRLRRDVKFHNGDPLTAEDVKFSFDRLRDQAQTTFAYRSLWANISKVEIMDPYTVAVYWSKPNGAFLNQSTWLVVGAVLPKKYFEKVGHEGFRKAPIGSGPYKFVSYTPGENLVMEAFTGYWGKIPEVKTVEFKFIPETGARLAALKTKEIDIMQQLPPFEAESVRKTAGLDVVSASNGEAFYYIFDQDNQPELRDLKVRQAFNYAINKEAIVKNIFLGYGTVMKSLGAPSVHGIDEPGYSYNPQKAKQLLQEANYKFETPITLNVTRGRWAMNEEVGQAIASDLSAVGINVKLNFMEYATYLSHVRAKKYASLTNMNRTNSAWDAAGTVKVCYRTGQTYNCWKNSDELDKLIDDIDAIFEPQERLKQLKRIFYKTWEETTALFLYEFHDIYGINKRIDWKIGNGEADMHFEDLKLR